MLSFSLAAVDMAFDFNFSFDPTTPPEYSFEQALEETSFNHGHSRKSSQGSNFSQESSPVSSYTQLTTPTKSPIRQHGPLLLPKIRPQDQAIESPPKRFKKTPLATAHNPAWRPSHNRSYTNPEPISLLTPVSASTNHSRSSSALCSPISMTEPNVFQRRGSGASLDGQTLGKYGFPTYRQMPTYIPSATNSQTETFVPQPYFILTPREPSPIRNEISFDVVPDSLSLLPADTTTTLMSYLTSANPPHPLCANSTSTSATAMPSTSGGTSAKSGLGHPSLQAPSPPFQISMPFSTFLFHPQVSPPLPHPGHLIPRRKPSSTPSTAPTTPPSSTPP